jgi:uncharacterized membrane protein
MTTEKETFWRWAVNKTRNHFLAGLLVVIPVAAALLVLIWVFSTVDGILQPVIELIFKEEIPGLGFAITIVLILLIGIIAGNYVGKKIIRSADSVLVKLPVFKQIYNGAKQVINSVAGSNALNKAAFREVVLVEFPTNGVLTVAFITNEYSDSNGKTLYGVYIPSTPVPTSGFSGLVTESQITRTNISVDDAFRMIVTGVMISPPVFQATRCGGEPLTICSQKAGEKGAALKGFPPFPDNPTV